MDSRIVPTERDFFVGKCQSCRHSIDGQSVGLLPSLFCQLDMGTVKPEWQCGRYEYEPGSLG